ncbi:PTS cellobiose transporter subunit IIB [Photorhabdus luminescens subsp. luminescens]|uniref:PTS system, cellobiose-specific IIB component n=3 Tax=Photorhabdus luminescens TaxID=29488 RepID=A0A1G5Q852_PHOLU|nr:PTS sugar transporter subunit IIB [Photorhabdus luminescens]KMW74287.1 PTS cellobiose transporter subunit IIB [Photorhabdus luminescens subsp. luminescens]MCW7761020.1 PTS sugar transporter subunit IIB [Photorhabdus luminescens subsp. venezuelensis]OWO80113.1 PTS sugar transporter subunit IIB [Photorhabdus luminescens]TDB56290.1 PTS sugar transporter subunit IIB [Photorhabdus luminescens subsp. mexicana]TNH43195.1 PTS sugar transporter subunit IIB [Photorhabdus luminescens subsp. sonorensis
MKKILLCCAAGMSTSILVQRMQAEVIKRALDIEIKAAPIVELEHLITDVDVVLLGPQVKYQLSHFSAIAKPLGKPIDVIDMMDYGTLRGDKVLDKALSLLE